MEASKKMLDCMQIVEGAPVTQINPSQQNYSFKYK
jgi:chromosome segregation ATPase